MKIINGIEYYSPSDVGAITGKSGQTIVLWDKYSDELESRGLNRLIPKPIRMKGSTIRTNFKYLEEQQEIKIEGKRMWTLEQVEAIVEFSKNLKKGDLAKFSRERWGERGKEIKERKNMESLDKHFENAKKMEEQRFQNRLKNM